MNRIRSTLTALAATVPLALLLASCSVQEAAEDAAGEAASRAATAASGEIKGQVCALVEDGLVSLGEQQVLSGLVGAAEAAGVPADILTPMRRIADAGDQVPEDAVNNLAEACA